MYRRQVNEYNYESDGTIPSLRCLGPKEVCIRPIQCNRTCDAAICDAIEDGFHNDKFNGIISRESWVTYGALGDKKVQPSTNGTETEFDLETRLSQALAERKSYDKNSAPSDTLSNATPPLPPETTSLPNSVSPNDAKDATAAVLEKDRL